MVKRNLTLLLAVLLVSCATIGDLTPRSPEDNMAWAVSVLTASNGFVANSLNAGTMSSDSALAYKEVKETADTLLVAYKSAFLSGDEVTMHEKWLMLENLIIQISTNYLAEVE